MKVSILLGTRRYELAKIKEERECAWEALPDIMANEAWSPYLFNGSHNQEQQYKWRRSQNMGGGELFALDIDDGLTMVDAVLRAQKLGFKAYVMPTKSHQKEKNGKVCDRFRIVFKLTKSLSHPSQVRPLFEVFKNYFPECDPACKDAARFFYPSGSAVAVSIEGVEFANIPEPQAEFNKELKQQAKEKEKYPLSNKTMEFIRQGAPDGRRNDAFISAAHDAIQQQWPMADYIELLSEHGQDWMVSDANLLKLEERYTNFTPSHPPRVPGRPKDPNRAVTLPLNRINEVLNKWLSDNEVAVSYSRTLYIGKVSFIIPDICRKITLYLADNNVAIDQKILDGYLTEWIEEKRMAHKETIREKFLIIDEEKGTKELEKWLSVLKAKYTPLDVYVLKHMIWQVKRKLFDLPTKYEMMLVLTGGQGAGKSIALRDYLFRPLEDLAYPTADFTILSDQRESRIFSDHYIVMFDEMSGAQRSDMERTKQIITAQTFKQRRMTTTQHDALTMNATFFGTANPRLENLIRDTTGMRRFFELRVDPRLATELRWYILKQIDCDLIWASVNQDEDSPLIPHLSSLFKEQENLRDKNIIEWAFDEQVLEKTNKEEEWTPAFVLNEAINIASKQNWSSKRLAKDWNDQNLIKKRRNDGVYYNVKICDNTLLRMIKAKLGFNYNKSDF